MNIRKPERVFWILNSSGWLLYTLFIVLVLKKKPITNLTVFYLSTNTYIIGFIITSGLRYAFNSIQKKSPSVYTVLILILLGSVVGAFAWNFADFFASRNFWKQETIDFYSKNLSFRRLVKLNYLNMAIVLAWSSLYFGIKFFIDFQIEKEKKEEALILAQRAELELLRYQLNPHFLFNSLNSVRGLIDENPANAKLMINELSEFLRYSLINKNVNFVTLNNELEAIKHYLSIEKKRFEEKLHIVYNIDPKAEKISIPSLLLHPLVENAVKHGMKTSPMPLTIEIIAKYENNKLIITICNSGKWTETNNGNEGTNTGLENVKKRLKNVYNDKAEFIIAPTADKVCISIMIDKNSNEQ